MLIDQKLNAFLDETASSSPAPGGGSVSALAGALSAALTSMVCSLTIGKKKYADVEETMKDVLTRSESLRKRLQDLIDEDTHAFQRVMDAFGLPKATDEEKTARSAAIQEATKGATDVPLSMIRAGSDLVAHIEAVTAHGNRNSISDAGVAALLLSASVRGAEMNVDINLSGIKDEEYVEGIRKECRTLTKNVTDRCESIARRVSEAITS